MKSHLFNSKKLESHLFNPMLRVSFVADKAQLLSVLAPHEVFVCYDDKRGGIEKHEILS